MTVKHLFYLTAARLSAYALRGERLSVGPSFEAGENGYAAFTDYLQTLQRGLLYVLADIVEEDFHLEMIPYLRGSDRRQVIARRTAQRYRDTSLSLALSLGTEKSERRDERLLLSAFTNTSLLQPWLNVIRQRRLPLVGVFSVALAAPVVLRRIAPKQKTALLVSLQPAGMRQTLVQNGKLRFSRLGPIDPADADQPTRIAAAFASETARIYQYLTAVRMLPREGATLDAILLAPPGRNTVIAGATSDIPQIRYRTVDTIEAATRVGLKNLPRDAGTEAVFLYALAKHTPDRQYAQEPLRRGFRLWQARAALLGAAAAVFAACAVGVFAEWWRLGELRYQMQVQQALTDQLNADYARVVRSFPAIPTTSDNLRTAVVEYAALARRVSVPDTMIRELSQALNSAPRVELLDLRWESAVSSASIPGRGDSAAPKRLPGAAAPAPVLYDVLHVTGQINGMPTSDYRAVNDAVNEFLAQLRQRPGLEVLKAKLPFDIGSETALSGDVLGTQGTAPAMFEVTLGSRVPQ